MRLGNCTTLPGGSCSPRPPALPNVRHLTAPYRRHYSPFVARQSPTSRRVASKQYLRPRWTAAAPKRHCDTRRTLAVAPPGLRQHHRAARTRPARGQRPGGGGCHFDCRRSSFSRRPSQSGRLRCCAAKRGRGEPSASFHLRRHRGLISPDARWPASRPLARRVPHQTPPLSALWCARALNGHRQRLGRHRASQAEGKMRNQLGARPAEPTCQRGREPLSSGASGPFSSSAAHARARQRANFAERASALRCSL